MKKLLLAMLFVATNIMAQDLNPIQFKTLKFYNTAGTQVYKFANTTGVTTALDTVVSEFIPLDADEYRFSIACGAGDTMYANLSYQLVAGLPSGNGFYARGGIAMAAKVDSMISLGTRTMIVGQTAKLVLTGHNLPIGHTSTQGGFGGSRDSTWTNTFGSGASTTGYSGFRIVMIQHIHNPADVSNTTILNQNRLVIRRF